MELLLATGNPHKKEELSRILHPHRVLIPSDLGISFDADETGTTYLENALIKARTLRDLSGGRTVLADDSGLSVPALGGAPGVYSARYGSDESDSELEAPERNQLLLANMADIKGENREAFFVCCMALILDDYRVFTAQETFSGIIALKPYGAGGFGYDP
ncbi:MAG: non-canonical purine NTP pyrophosphatase, partial [Spirochaetes bacterium]